MRARPVIAVLLGALLVGCASRPAAPARRDPDAGAAGPEPRADLEALLREREAFFSAEATVGSMPPASSMPKRRALPKRGGIDRRRVARIEAMSWNGLFGRGATCTAEEEPLAANGGLCGDVRWPLATLTEAEKASVLGLLDRADRTYGPGAMRDGSYGLRPVVRCEFDPHHALLLYDAANVLLGAITVCMTCHEWLVRPESLATGEDGPVLFDAEERSALSAIFDHHGLGAWIFDDEDPRHEAARAYARTMYGTEEAPTPRGILRRRQRLEAHPSGIPRDKRLNDLTRSERDALCAWTSDEVRPGRRNGGGHGYECSNGVAWVASYGERECGLPLLPCPQTVGELEACLRELREPEDLCGPPPEPCRSLMRCLPGIAARPPR